MSPEVSGSETSGREPPEGDALEVSADLTVEGENGTITVRSYTDRLFVDLSSVALAARLGRVVLRNRRSFLRAIEALSRADLTLSIRVRGTEIAVCAAAAKLSAPERSVPIEFRARGVCSAFAGELLRSLLDAGE